jgi:hypothetical protein
MVSLRLITMLLMVIGAPVWANCAADDHSCQGARPELSDGEWERIRRPYDLRTEAETESALDKDIDRIAIRFNLLERKEPTRFDEGAKEVFETELKQIDFNKRNFALRRAVQRASRLTLAQQEHILDLHQGYLTAKNNSGSRSGFLQMAGAADGAISRVLGFSGEAPRQYPPADSTRGIRAFPKP